MKAGKWQTHFPAFFVEARCMKSQEQIIIRPDSDTAVLLVHGIVGTPRQFRDLLPVIPEAWSVYNIVLDGHGYGVEEFARTSMKKWKAQVSAKLDEILLTHKHVLMVCHSMGTLFAIQEAINRPEAIRALFLLQCPLRVHYPPKTAWQCIRTALGKHDPAAEKFRDACGLELTNKLWKYAAWLPRFWELLCVSRRIRNLIEELKTPCMAFPSGKDELVSMRTCKDLARNPEIQVTVLRESGHFSYSEQDRGLIENCLREMIEKYFETKNE
jgi:esterase/lipase